MPPSPPLNLIAHFDIPTIGQSDAFHLANLLLRVIAVSHHRDIGPRNIRSRFRVIVVALGSTLVIGLVGGRRRRFLVLLGFLVILIGKDIDVEDDPLEPWNALHVRGELVQLSGSVGRHRPPIHPVGTPGGIGKPELDCPDVRAQRANRRQVLLVQSVDINHATVGPEAVVKGPQGGFNVPHEAGLAPDPLQEDGDRRSLARV
ncbi:hypothetical protein PG993_011044 [Apiospora rasikravindrae]|uniref:Uncharacterized protein n=1 Tax=Apiospora rasikravindrae TaxID=990691 RepID=A0ABR1SD41_9PEZI